MSAGDSSGDVVHLAAPVAATARLSARPRRYPAARDHDRVVFAEGEVHHLELAPRLSSEDLDDVLTLGAAFGAETFGAVVAVGDGHEVLGMSHLVWGWSSDLGNRLRAAAVSGARGLQHIRRYRSAAAVAVWATKEKGRVR
jgi:hypothetical protein